MSKLRLISIFLIIMLNCFAAAAEESRNNLKGPINITSETLTADNKEHTALFEKNVIAKTATMTLYADAMLVYYAEQGGEVTKIEATGNVKLNKENRVITSKRADYFAEEDKVVFTGDPRAVDGENVVIGTKITYFVQQDRSYVENSKVFLKNKKENK